MRTVLRPENDPIIPSFLVWLHVHKLTIFLPALALWVDLCNHRDMFRYALSEFFNVWFNTKCAVLNEFINLCVCEGVAIYFYRCNKVRLLSSQMGRGEGEDK